MNTAQMKEQLIKTMSDEQLAKVVTSMQQMPSIFARNPKYVKMAIQEVCRRVDTKDATLISIQDYIVKRTEILLTK